MEAFLRRCETEGGENPLRTRCPMCCGRFDNEYPIDFCDIRIPDGPRGGDIVFIPIPNPGPMEDNAFIPIPINADQPIDHPAAPSGCFSKQCGCPGNSAAPNWCKNKETWPSMTSNAWCNATPGRCEGNSEGSCGGTWCALSAVSEASDKK
jgi:hypothetical protein